MERLRQLHVYMVSFDTQRERVYRNYEYRTVARNQKEAIAAAREAWYSKPNRPHMFHCEAVKQSLPEGKQLDLFVCVNWRPVTWGYRN